VKFGIPHCAVEGARARPFSGTITRHPPMGFKSRFVVVDLVSGGQRGGVETANFQAREVERRIMGTD